MYINVSLGCFLGIFFAIWFAAEIGPVVFECRDWNTILRLAAHKEDLDQGSKKKLRNIRLLIEAGLFIVLIVINVLAICNIYTWIIPMVINSICLLAIIVLGLVVRIQSNILKRDAVATELEEDDE